MRILFWRTLVCIFLLLAMIGVLLPGVPTTVFLILTAWAAAKGWPQMDAWLMAHPRYGATLRNWRAYGTVPRKVKIVACSMMALSAVIMLFTNAPDWVKVFTNLSMLAVAIWLCLRPEPSAESKHDQHTLSTLNLTTVSNLIAASNLPVTSADNAQASVNARHLTSATSAVNSTSATGHATFATAYQALLQQHAGQYAGQNLAEADVLIDLATQRLYVPKQQLFFAISSGLNGIGEQEGSGQTPRGWHSIAAKIGADAPLNAVFVARQFTGEIYNNALAQQHPQRDWILTRILWLDGLQAGFNKGAGCDSKARYIYIHGTPDSEPMGVPRSHGCVRMRNHELLQVFNAVQDGALVCLLP